LCFGTSQLPDHQNVQWALQNHMAPPLGVYPIVQYPPPVEDLQTAECELDRTRTENTEAQRALFEYIIARKRKQLADWEDMLVRR
jgi:hypothetical protein